jgi:hypothetical protein
MGRGEKHRAEQIVNLLRQAEVILPSESVSHTPYSS